MSEVWFKSKRDKRIKRLFEILPGLTSWGFIFLPIVLSFIQPILVAYIIITFYLLWLSKAFGLTYRLLRGYRWLDLLANIDWLGYTSKLNNPRLALKEIDQKLKNKNLKIKTKRLLRYLKQRFTDVINSDNKFIKPNNIRHLVIVATFNESLDTLEPTVKCLLDANYDLKKIFLVIAYEERGGKRAEENVNYLIKKYGSKFGYAKAIMHPDGIPDEHRGKGANITNAGRRMEGYLKSRGINPEHVIVTTLDADNRPSKQYFGYLTFEYIVQSDRIHKSFQPVPMYLNNIWDVPAPMRVIATGSSFWVLMEAMRPHRLRNFSAHAQSFKTLLDTDFWSVNTIVEDGHQYWRTYFRYNGNHQVIPLYTPVYQDAVLATSYIRTFKAQFYQLRRWAWGASDIAYVFVQSIRHKKIGFFEKTIQFLRLYEGHFSWATAPLILAFAAWLPLLLNSEFNDLVLAHQLPVIASRIQTIALLGVFVTIYVSMVSLPPRPSHYKPHRTIFMILQWALLPITTIVFAAFAALNAQTRLMFGRYLEKFDVTEKAVKK